MSPQTSLPLNIQQQESLTFIADSPSMNCSWRGQMGSRQTPLSENQQISDQRGTLLANNGIRNLSDLKSLTNHCGCCKLWEEFAQQQSSAMLQVEAKLIQKEIQMATVFQSLINENDLCSRNLEQASQKILELRAELEQWKLQNTRVLSEKQTNSSQKASRKQLQGSKCTDENRCKQRSSPMNPANPHGQIREKWMADETTYQFTEDSHPQSKLNAQPMTQQLRKLRFENQNLKSYNQALIEKLQTRKGKHPF